LGLRIWGSSDKDNFAEPMGILKVTLPGKSFGRHENKVSDRSSVLKNVTGTYGFNFFFKVS